MVDQLTVTETEIPGLLIIDLPLHGDSRGWFKENWQREKMIALGLPDFTPVQNNVSFNAESGVTRGIHADPWDKLISVASGRIYGAWVDLREGPSFGKTVACEAGLDRAVFVPRGVGNSFQALAENTVYSYLVNEHWSAAARESYTMLNLADPTAAIQWPIPLDQSVRSEADLKHPMLHDVRPMRPRRTLILGAQGQLGRALQWVFPEAEALTRAECDLADLQSFDWTGVGTIINAAAYTAVDAAETDRATTWATNVTALVELTRIARAHRATLVNVSSDYVFDGSASEPYAEDAPMSPLGFYGVTKAAGDAVVATWERHYTVRTSWVIGDGKNFVATMKSLAERGISPSVVNDQRGRPTFTETLAAAICHLLRSGAEYGTYNVTNSGPTTTWAQVAAEVFTLAGHDPTMVTPVTTEEYFAGKSGVAPRPMNSTLSLTKLEATGFHSPAAGEMLRQYVASK